MDGAQVTSGFDPNTLGQIPPTLQAIVDQGALSGFVTLVWRKGEIAQVRNSMKKSLRQLWPSH